jgi:hypothetical protein
LRKLAIVLGAGLVACGGLWFALRPPHLSQEKIAEMLKAQAEVEDSVKCGRDFSAGSSAYVQCMAQSAAARTQGSARAQLDAKGGKVTSTVAGVGAAMVMLIVFVTMMLIFGGFWTLGTRIGLDEMRR